MRLRLIIAMIVASTAVYLILQFQHAALRRFRATVREIRTPQDMDRFKVWQPYLLFQAL
jgi:hypothetical protein